MIQTPNITATTPAACPSRPMGRAAGRLTWLAMASVAALFVVTATPALFVMVAATPALAQEKGKIKAQGKVIDKEEKSSFIRTLTDPTEEMRLLVQEIAQYGRKTKRNFFTIPMDAFDLMVKTEEDNENIISPARTFIRSIDGIMQRAMYYGDLKFGQAPPAVIQKRLFSRSDLAIRNGLKVFSLDFTRDRKAINQTLAMSTKRGFVPFVAHEMDVDLGTLPPYPKRPVNENPNSIISMKQVKNFLMLRETAGFGRQDEFAMRIHDTNYDLLVVDVFHGREPLSKRAVETLKFKKTGGRRLVAAYINISTAASYQYFWKSGWREGNPLWIRGPVRRNPDRHYVEYWNPAWKKIIYGNTKSYVYGAIDLGFDGIVLDGLNAIPYFKGVDETDGREDQ